MITPKDIESKDFTKSFRGYDADEVDEFLDLIIIDMQEITEEITKLRNENEELRAENEEHKKSQKRVMDTLDSAKKLMRDISESAEKRADIIIRNAKMDAEMILNEAKTSAGKYAGADGEELRDKVAYFRSRYRQLLLDELDSMENKGGDLLSALEREFVPASGEFEALGEFKSFDELPQGSTTTISEEEMEKALGEVKYDFESAVKISDEE
ncbi:MAG: DivIVA domain-containing protein [Firmicutes bacterium]|nr:DivIVA domain-containing protein [Bacillota bacterium]